MGTFIFWSIVGIYWTVGISRVPTYYRRWYQHDRDQYASIHSEQDSQRSGAWHAIGLMLVWPYYEGLRWVRDTIIHTMTAEERRQREYENAERIVAEYKTRKEQQEREAFDRQLRGED